MHAMDRFTGKRILITGGLGFIGSALAHRLLELEANITVVDSLIPQYGGNLFNVKEISDRIRINISDVRDPYSMRYLVKGQDFLFNLAGQTSHMDSMQDPFTDLEINSRAQLSILEACRHHNPEVKIIFASTRQIYGKPEYLPVDEKHPLRPVDVNGINKISAEQYHLLYYHVYGLRTCALRLTNTYGPRMRVKDARQTFLGIWIRHVVEGIPFEVWGGEQLRDFNYVEDAADAFLIAAMDENSNGRVFNLGGDEVKSLKELAECLIRIAGGEYIFKEFPESHKRIDIGNYHSDYSLIQSVLGWKPKTGLEQGLKQTVEYYRKNLNQYI